LTKVVKRTADGRHVVLALRGAGDIVGELATINDGSRSASVIAITGVDALVIGRQSFKMFLHRYPAAAESLYRTVVNRLCEADWDRLAAASMNVGQRLARLLLKIAQRYGVATPAGIRIVELSQKELAASVGGGERTVARQIAGWRERHIISTDRRSITIHRPDSLERIAGRHAPP
jgi:CRP-like cAMP-binding protein